MGSLGHGFLRAFQCEEEKKYEEKLEGRVPSRREKEEEESLPHGEKEKEDESSLCA